MKRSLKKMWKAFSMLLAVILLVGTAGMQASAEEEEGTGSTAATAVSVSPSFDKYLVMDKNANVPNAVFTFTIAPGAAVDAADTAPQVLAGPAGGATISGTAAFTPADTTYDTLQTGDVLNLAAGLGADQKYAAKTVNITADGTKFTAPGIYRYVITEEATSISGITNDTDTTRVLDLYVTSDANGALTVSSAVLHKDASVLAAGSYTSKDSGFTNTYATSDLTISKTVTGNQGFRNKYFTFNVSISGAAAGTVYTVNLDAADETAGSNTNASTLTADSNGAVTGTFYLKHGQSIVIQGLTSGTTYTVTESIDSSEGYTTSYVIGSADSVTGTATGAQEMGTADQTVAFTNHREGTVPTGILVDVAPYLLIFLLAGAGFVVLFGRKRRRA